MASTLCVYDDKKTQKSFGPQFLDLKYFFTSKIVCLNAVKVNTDEGWGGGGWLSPNKYKNR